jgi:hypothetical protein
MKLTTQRLVPRLGMSGVIPLHTFILWTVTALFCFVVMIWTDGMWRHFLHSDVTILLPWLRLLELCSDVSSKPDVIAMPPWLRLLKLSSDVSSKPDIMVIPPWLRYLKLCSDVSSKPDVIVTPQLFRILDIMATFWMFILLFVGRRTLVYFWRGVHHLAGWTFIYKTWHVGHPKLDTPIPVVLQWEILVLKWRNAVPGVLGNCQCNNRFLFAQCAAVAWRKVAEGTAIKSFVDLVRSQRYWVLLMRSL